MPSTEQDPPQHEPADEAAWSAEIERRARRFLAGETEGILAADVFAMAEERLGERRR